MAYLESIANFINQALGIWALAPPVLALLARTRYARAIAPGLVTCLYLYLPIHGLIFLVFYLMPSSGLPFLFVSIACFWFFFFDLFIADSPELLPPAVYVWAFFWPGVLKKDRSGLVDTDRIAERVKRQRLNPIDAVRAKAETYKAKVDTYQLTAAKEYEDAQTELARAAREYNEAKLRAEEAKRRSAKRGG